MNERKTETLDGSTCNFIKKEALAQVFSREFYEISKNTFFYRTPSVPAYMMKWNPALGEFLKAQLEPENKFEKCDAVVGHLSK